jgi:hypothetical protein
MFILHFLPDGLLEFVVNAVLLLGMVSCVLTFFVLNRLMRMFPVLANYHLIMQVVSVLILSAGLYFKGGYSTEMMWRERVAEVEARLKLAEEQSKKVNTVIQEKIVNRTQVIKEKGEKQIEYIDKVVIQKEDVVKYVEKCPAVPKSIVDEINKAAMPPVWEDKK